MDNAPRYMHRVIFRHIGSINQHCTSLLLVWHIEAEQNARNLINDVSRSFLPDANSCIWIKISRKRDLKYLIINTSVDCSNCLFDANHYLNQWWIASNEATGTKLACSLNKKTFFITNKVKISSEMSAIWFKPQSVTVVALQRRY